MQLIKGTALVLGSLSQALVEVNKSLSISISLVGAALPRKQTSRSRKPQVVADIDEGLLGWWPSSSEAAGGCGREKKPMALHLSKRNE